MSTVQIKKFAVFTGSVMLAILVVNTLAKRVPAVAGIKSTIENGI